MSLPTASSQSGRRIAQFPNRPSMLAQRQMADAMGTTAPPPPEPGPHYGNEITDFQWILAWAALGLTLWLFAKTAIGYRVIYYIVLALIILVLVTQSQFVQAIFAPFGQLGAGLTGSGSGSSGGSGSGGGKAGLQNNRSANANMSRRGPRSAPKSGSAAAGRVTHTAETASTFAALS